MFIVESEMLEHAGDVFFFTVFKLDRRIKYVALNRNLLH